MHWKGTRTARVFYKQNRTQQGARSRSWVRVVLASSMRWNQCFHRMYILRHSSTCMWYFYFFLIMLVAALNLIFARLPVSKSRTHSVSTLSSLNRVYNRIGANEINVKLNLLCFTCRWYGWMWACARNHALYIAVCNMYVTFRLNSPHGKGCRGHEKLKFSFESFV